jgi:hypothetical protein
MGGGWWIDETIKKRHSQLATTEVEFVHIISQRGMKHSKVFRGALYVSEIERLIQSLRSPLSGLRPVSDFHSFLVG